MREIRRKARMYPMLLHSAGRQDRLFFRMEIRLAGFGVDLKGRAIEEALAVMPPAHTGVGRATDRQGLPERTG
jgi:hypothetical protein